MRKSKFVIAVVAGCSLLAGSAVYAQKPAGTTGGRFPAPVGAAGTTGNLGNTSMGNLGLPTPARPSSGGGRKSGSPAAPTRTQASFGGTTSGGINLPRSGSHRQVRKNSTPVLSSYLNLDPNFVNSDEGQYFTKTVPQQDFNRTQLQTQRAFQGVQSEIGQQQATTQSGLGTTGHTTSFMNTGRYYPGR